MLINVMSLYLANMAKRSVTRVFDVFGGLCKNYRKHQIVFEVFRTYTKHSLIKFREFLKSNSRVIQILNLTF